MNYDLGSDLLNSRLLKYDSILIRVKFKIWELNKRSTFFILTMEYNNLPSMEGHGKSQCNFK